MTSKSWSIARIECSVHGSRLLFQARTRKREKSAFCYHGRTGFAGGPAFVGPAVAYNSFQRQGHHGRSYQIASGISKASAFSLSLSFPCLCLLSQLSLSICICVLNMWRKKRTLSPALERISGFAAHNGSIIFIPHGGREGLQKPHLTFLTLPRLNLNSKNQFGSAGSRLFLMNISSDF